MGQHELDRAGVDPERHRTGSGLGACAPVVDQLLAVEVADPVRAEVVLGRCQDRRLGSRSGGFPTAQMSPIWRSMRSPKVLRRAIAVHAGASP